MLIMNDDTYITEINTLEDADELFRLVKKDLTLNLVLSIDRNIDRSYLPNAVCPKLYYGAGYATFKKNTLRNLTQAAVYFTNRMDISETRNSFSIFFNETMPEGHRIGFFSILDWEVDEIMNITTTPELIGRTPRPVELYPKMTIGELKQHLLDTVRKYKQFEVELKKKEIKDAVLGYEGN